MGRETKVGLLVGMCFIVCFAIILSRRSERTVDTQSMTFEIATVITEAPAVGYDAAAATRELPASGPAVTRRVAPMTPPPAPAVTPQTPLRRPTTPAAEPDESAVASGARVPSPREGLADSSMTSANDAARFERRTAPIIPPSFAVDGLTRTMSAGPLIAGDSGSSSQPLRLSMPGRVQEEWASATPMPLASPETQVATAGVPDPLPPSQESPTGEADQPRMELRVPDRPRAELARYVVQKGDTLSKIAKEHYGTQRPDVVKALYEANRDQLPNPNTIIPGKELMVPVLREVATDHLAAALAQLTQGETGSTEPVAGAPASEPVQAPEESGGDEPAKVADAETDRERNDFASSPDLHVVAAGESLSKIARKHYGSDSKAVLDALQEANRKQIKDKDRLVVGTKLVLPNLSDRGETSARPSRALVAVTAPDLRERTPDKPSAKPSRKGDAWYWYTLKPGECYTTVAAKKLGTSKRWTELADLNKDIFPDAKKIRSGMRIRVPRDASSPGDAPSGRDAA
jgi:nucleoid-associated protein YgaU